MTEIIPNKYYIFIRSYPFKWRYFSGPYNNKGEADYQLLRKRTVSPRTVMLGQDFLSMREEWSRKYYQKPEEQS